jgi:hypothetical protein
MILLAARLALLSAAVAALLLARRRADHLPFAALLTWGAIVDGVRVALDGIFGLLRPLGSPPFTGAARVAFHVDEAISLSTTAATVIVAILLFSQRRWMAALPGVAWIGAVAYLSALYPDPAVRGEGLRRVYLATELGAVMVAIGMIVRWTWRRLPPTPAHVALLGVVLVDAVALLFGAMRWGLWSRYGLDQIAVMMLYVTLTAYQVISWRFSASSSQ